MISSFHQKADLALHIFLKREEKAMSWALVTYHEDVLKGTDASLVGFAVQL